MQIGKLLRGNRKFKDRLFRLLYSDKKKLLELYNALNGSNYENEEDLEITTPLYVIFYNGNEEIGERKILRLSDAFIHGNTQSKMELEAVMLNINYGHNRELMEKCKTLREYAAFVDKVKQYTKRYELGEGIEKAIDDCIQEDVLRDFLVKRRAEVVHSILTEYDEERVLADLKKDSYDDGKEDGILEGRQEGIRVLAESLKELHVSKEDIVETVVKKFKLSLEEAIEVVDKTI